MLSPGPTLTSALVPSPNSECVCVYVWGGGLGVGGRTKQYGFTERQRKRKTCVAYNYWDIMMMWDETAAMSYVIKDDGEAANTQASIWTSSETEGGKPFKERCFAKPWARFRKIYIYIYIFCGQSALANSGVSSPAPPCARLCESRQPRLRTAQSPRPSTGGGGSQCVVSVGKQARACSSNWIRWRRTAAGRHNGASVRPRRRGKGWRRRPRQYATKKLGPQIKRWRLSWRS